jgi:hypothetical protein
MLRVPSAEFGALDVIRTRVFSPAATISKTVLFRPQ